MPVREIRRAGIAEAYEERRVGLMHHWVFQVHQRHQQELPPRLLGFVLQQGHDEMVCFSLAAPIVNL
jgi:hypothetical protein